MNAIVCWYNSMQLKLCSPFIAKLVAQNATRSGGLSLSDTRLAIDGDCYCIGSALLAPDSSDAEDGGETRCCWVSAKSATIMPKMRSTVHLNLSLRCYLLDQSSGF